jgi:hypothetical protein
VHLLKTWLFMAYFPTAYTVYIIIDRQDMQT